MARMKPPRAPEAPPPILTEDQQRRSLEVCTRDKSFAGRRDEAILRVLIDTGPSDSFAAAGYGPNFLPGGHRSTRTSFWARALRPLNEHGYRAVDGLPFQRANPGGSRWGSVHGRHTPTVGAILPGDSGRNEFVYPDRGCEPFQDDVMTTIEREPLARRKIANDV